MVRPYKVLLHIERVAEFLVDANSPEEAELIAEDYYRDGELGITANEEVLASEAYPVEEEL